MQDRLHILEDLNMLYIRQFALSLEDTELQRKLEHEIRMREGACKLLAACSQREQRLEVTKNLLVCNGRILSYMGELQRRKEAQALGRTARRPSDAGAVEERVPCRGRVCVSDLRIPLMWKDTEYFRNKGDPRRWAVFLLLRLGEQIQDTEMVLVDRTLTDISFQTSVLFAEAGPDFELRLELYGASAEEEGALSAAPRRLATRLTSSLGRSSGRRVRAAVDAAGGAGGAGPALLPAPAAGGPRYHLLAQTVLTLAEVQDGFRTHDLTLTSTEESPAWLPLYGSVCCRLAAQPLCMTRPTMSGHVTVQGGQRRSRGRMYAVLQGTRLSCYRRPEEAEGGEEPALTIPINKETRIRAGERAGGPGGPARLSISNRCGGGDVTYVLWAGEEEEEEEEEGRAALRPWMEAFWQLFHDMGQWKQCCDQLMSIEAPAPRKPPVPLPKQGSLYHEMAIEPLDDIAAVTDILAQREGPRRADLPAAWLALLDPGGRPPRGSSPAPPGSGPPAWGRPRTLSLDDATRGRPPAPRPRRPPPPRGPPGLRGELGPGPWLQSPV
ncbi:rhotekin isoform X2 [Ornithorhynchus anatinus]|uniref:rhotekin isoform X2 n=1 Tax=Ornithorhynchus anatinus TaxID=9258 RepID=UPI0010A946E8|nr:rhotekin isoform X2 [Ornithorhynchus anatinus]